MDLAALFSGGKDSTYALYLAQQKGWTIKHLVSAVASEGSFLFHVPNIQLTSLHSEAMRIPLRQFEASGEEKEELVALQDTLKELDVEGLVTGAVASDYQWSRFNRIGEEIGLKVFSPLWRKDQKRVLEDIISAGFEVIIVGVSAEGLDESWLGRRIDEECLKDLERLEQEKGINISGEGGEYETLVLNAPNFEKRLEIEETEEEWDGKRGTLKVQRAALAGR
ncbi:MAG: diphthine--ammonia ligase, partial [Thermoplasmata archaeon]